MEILKYITYVIIAILAIALYLLYKAYTEVKQEDADKPLEIAKDVDIEKLPFRRKFLLTTNEYRFYKKLKIIADKLDYAVLSKVRWADLIEVNAEAEKNEYMKYFAKIRSKHIDFLLCNKENLYPELLIELNDNSHKKESRIKRDEFLSKVSEKTGYKLLFVYNNDDLEKEILTKLGKAEEAKTEN